MSGTFVVIILLVIGVMLHALPALTRPEIFFSVTVLPEFRRTPDGRSATRAYRLTIWISTALAIVLDIAANFAIAALLVQLLGVVWALVRAHKAVYPHRVAPPSIVEVDLSAAPERLPGGPWVAAAPLVSLAALAVWVALRFTSLPARFPIHWGFHGPDGWVHTSPMTISVIIAVQACLCLLMVGMAWGILNWSHRVTTVGLAAVNERGFRRRAATLLIACAYLMAGIAWLPVLRPGSRILSISAVIFPVLILAFTFTLVREGQGGWRAASARAGNGDRTPDACWKWGLVYVNPADPAVFVEKRFGIGYTLNFGNYRSWLVMVLLLAPAVIALTFLRAR